MFKNLFIKVKKTAEKIRGYFFEESMYEDYACLSIADMTDMLFAM